MLAWHWLYLTSQLFESTDKSLKGFQKAALSAHFSAKRTRRASLWGISAPKAARPPWWSSGRVAPAARRPRAARSAAAGAGRRRRSRGGGRGEGGEYAGSPAGVRGTEARARGDWREAGEGAADAAPSLGLPRRHREPEPERHCRRLRAEREWGRERNNGGPRI